MGNRRLNTNPPPSIFKRADSKIVFTLILILTGLLTPAAFWPIRSGLLILELTLLLAIHTEAEFWLKQLPLFLFFIGSIALALPLSTGFSGGWERAGIIFVRGTIAFGASAWLIRVLSPEDFLQTLKRWHLPLFLVESLSFMLRYLTTLDSERRTLQRTRHARTFHPTPLKQQWQGSARLITTLLTRALKRANRVYRAMKARNWRGYS